MFPLQPPFHQAILSITVLNFLNLRSASAPALGPLGDTRDKALRAMDSGVDMVFIATFGRPGALFVFVVLALLTSYLAYVRGCDGARGLKQARATRRQSPPSSTHGRAS